MQGPFDITADLDTPVSAWLKLADLGPRFLLESVEGGERLARYSFLGFGPGREVRLDADGFRVDGESRPLPRGRDELLDGLRQALAGVPRLAPEAEELPFTGGLVGVSGYDLVRWFERLPDGPPAQEGMPLAAYVAPESLLVFDHLTRRAALLHAGSESERRALRTEVIGRLRGAVPQDAQEDGGRVEDATASVSPEDYMAAVEQAKEHIAAGDIYQIVLSVCFSGASTVSPFEAYRALRLLNPSPYLFFVDLGDLQVVGSSPEALVRLNGRRASLRPIAGTLPRGATTAEDRANEQRLLADPKEIAEHVMLVDLARNDLGRVAEAGSVHVDPYLSIERYSHVMHIVSGVQGTLAEDRDAFDLFAAAFPAGTLVGAPKVRAMEIIDAMEPVGRGLYAGTVGYFGHGGDMDQAITIRTMVFRDGQYRFQAGAGLVADSVPAREYEEVMAKSAILRRALDMAKEGL
ncbi:anthranilate synthase component I family protein [Lentisalinibacter orientalis]|uniref:anthranilate synthase component I family protein n=1 Tax=Lentisalinibacter orientalis TaxID=2992241 RepID=UPI00386A3E54